LRWASAIALRPAALIFRLGRVVAVSPADVSPADELPVRSERSAAICSSILRFCASKPSIAASMISVVSVEGIPSTFWHGIVSVTSRFTRITEKQLTRLFGGGNGICMNPNLPYY
jgi:hypothetical protein